MTPCAMATRRRSRAIKRRLTRASTPRAARQRAADLGLELGAAGLNLQSFQIFHAPRPLARAVELLRQLGAVEGRVAEGGVATTAAGGGAGPVRLTAMGRMLVEYPLHPRYARVLEAAREAGCGEDFALLLAIIQGRALFGKSGGAVPSRFVEGDEFSDLLPLWRAWEAATASIAKARTLGRSASSSGGMVARDRVSNTRTLFGADRGALQSRALRL
mgnify:CR=1 FL=1